LITTKKRYSFISITALAAVMLLYTFPLSAQLDSSAIRNRGRNAVIITSGAYIATTAFLYSTWYSNYPQSSFHFFNDNNEWQMMDKLGHAGSAYYLSRWNTAVFRAAGMERDKAARIGTATAYGFLLGIEVLDGFSAEWGASPGDLVANTLGASLFLLQERFWEEQRITFKLSVRPTTYAAYRPELLGETVAERILKDYNGQTYWLSVNPASFMKKETKFPKWLNLSLGYGAEGMIGGEENPSEYNNVALPKFERYKQFYFAPDIDLTKIKTNSAFVKTISEVFGFIKIPAPTLEFNSKGEWKFYPLYF
jgi:hypothetical protein